MTLSVGDLLQNRYRIEGLLGRGGMGAVYRAYDLVLSVPVAIKENLNPAPESIRQFKREAVLLASLRHTHLPRVTDHFVVGSRQYLVMDFVAGEDLKTRLEKEGAFSQAQVLDWAKEVCDALTYLHTRKPSVIHRDIKPANIKLTPEGQAILVDFGIAKVADTGAGTSTGARSLTPGFAPPEQYGTRTTDARSDQYSLAATLYTLLTGQIPPDSLERTLGQTNFRSPREINSRVSSIVDRAIMRALSLNPEERFGSVAEFRDALCSTVEPAPPLEATAPRAPGPPPKTPPSAKGQPRPGKRPWGWLAIAAVVILVIAALAVALLMLHVSPAAPAATAAPPSPPVAGALQGGSEAAPSSSPSAPLSLASPSARAPTPSAVLSPTETPSPSALPTPVGGSALIAFASNRSPDGLFQIYTLNVTTGEVKQLTSDPTNKGHPAWTADGSKLVYEAEMAKGNRDLFVMNADGSDPLNITKNPADDFHPAINPRNSILAFVSTRDPAGAEQIFVMGLDGSNIEDISNLQSRMPEEWDPAWSADGHYLLLVRKVVGPVRIYRWDLGSPDATILTMFAGNYTEGQPAWSPKGNLVAYTETLFSGDSAICVAVADSPPLKPCTTPVTDFDGNSSPTFSPDGRWIAYTSDRTGIPQIALMTVTGADQKNLTSAPSQNRDPAWQPASLGGSSS